jgi:hypothetical protein
MKVHPSWEVRMGNMSINMDSDMDLGWVDQSTSLLLHPSRFLSDDQHQQHRFHLLRPGNTRLDFGLVAFSLRFRSLAMLCYAFKLPRLHILYNITTIIQITFSWDLSSPFLGASINYVVNTSLGPAGNRKNNCLTV